MGYHVGDKVIVWRPKIGIVEKVEGDNVIVYGAKFDRLSGKCVDNYCPWCYLEKITEDEE